VQASRLIPGIGRTKTARGKHSPGPSHLRGQGLLTNQNISMSKE